MGIVFVWQTRGFSYMKMVSQWSHIFRFPKMYVWFYCSHCPSRHKMRRNPSASNLAIEESKTCKSENVFNSCTCRTLSIPYVRLTNFGSSPGGAILVWYRRICASPVIEGINSLLKGVSWTATSISEFRTSSRVEILLVVDWSNATIFAVYDETTKNRQIKAKNFRNKFSGKNRSN